MNQSGDAAEQIVRMSLEGVEVAAKITGSAAKEIATFLVAALKSKDSKLKLKGKARMTSMLKSGKALEIFSVKDSDLQKFAQGAKQYGIVYCVLRNRKNSPDGLCDIMVKADDAPRISRLVERFKFATVDKAKIESTLVKSQAEKAQAAGQPTLDKNDTEKLLDDLLGTPEGKPAPDTPETVKAEPDKTAAQEAPAKQNPDAAKAEKPLPSEPTSESRRNSAKGTLSKPSVKEEIREIRAARAKQEADAPKRDEKAAADRPKSQTTTHKQPQPGGKSKSKKPKERA
ncbi:PcfB family protein [Caproiciproducens sp. CPB-2]|uniref:PcfB family protein n=1 Tax=Caproiciproducens sp. CPB-2 TaxID=3030017 RepID=UPI0023DC937A|nr:DUF3801 domain-containing protein [Caproiciproducens sp. CPB-2]MDF1494557.1 DUF3801 domain-containing protein [Caproiciproducens sp. CPB-2]